jgi:hypothetical protein
VYRVEERRRGLFAASAVLCPMTMRFGADG